MQFIRTTCLLLHIPPLYPGPLLLPSTPTLYWVGLTFTFKVMQFRLWLICKWKLFWMCMWKVSSRLKNIILVLVFYCLGGAPWGRSRYNNWLLNYFNLMWTFITVTLHKLTGVRHSWTLTRQIIMSPVTSIGYTRKDTGVIERLWHIGFWKHRSFVLFLEEGDIRCTVYIVRKVVLNLRSIKGKTMDKVFSWLVEWRVQRRNCHVLTVRVATSGTVGSLAQRQE